MNSIASTSNILITSSTFSNSSSSSSSSSPSSSSSTSPSTSPINDSLAHFNSTNSTNLNISNLTTNSSCKINSPTLSITEEEEEEEELNDRFISIPSPLPTYSFKPPKTLSDRILLKKSNGSSNSISTSSNNARIIEAKRRAADLRWSKYDGTVSFELNLGQDELRRT